MKAIKQTHSPPSNSPQSNKNYGYAYKCQELLQSHWDTAYIDQKFYIAHPLTIDKLFRLSDQIKKQKIKLSESQIGSRIHVQKGSHDKSQISQMNAHTKPQSDRSRDCKTQINMLEEMKFRMKVEKQLDEEEKKYKIRLEEMKGRRANKQSEFIIKDLDDTRKYTQTKQDKQIAINRAQKPLKESMKDRAGKHEQNESEKVDKIEKYRFEQINKVAYLPQPDHIASERSQNNKERSKKQPIPPQEIQQLKSSRKSQVSSVPSKQAKKSFVISAKNRSKSHRSGFSSNQKYETKNHSRKQIEELNKKLDSMQEKLDELQKKQNHLEQIQMSRISIIQPQTNKQTTSKQKAETPFMQTTVLKNNDHLVESKVSDQRSTNEPFFDIKIQKINKLGFVSSAVQFSNSKSMQNDRILEQNEQKERMMQQINKLKKTIRELQLQKIKYEESTSYKRSQESYDIRISPQKNPKVAFKSHQLTKNIFNSFPSEEQVRFKSSNTQELSKLKINSAIKKSAPKYEYNHMDSSQSPIPKKEKVTSINLDNKNNIIALEKSSQDHKNTKQRVISLKQFIDSSMNPQYQPQARSFYPHSLRKKGIIAKEVMTKEDPDKQFKRTHRSNVVQVSQKQNQLTPPSPTSTGKKIFELQFIKQEKKSQMKQQQAQQEITIEVPQLKVNEFKIPAIPKPPTPQMTQSELMALAKQIFTNFDIENEDFDQISLKKYKNCIIFKTLDAKTTIVWHYSGKLYIGGWEQNPNGEGKKIGQGFQYVPDKYYYKGQFLDGKKNGSGIMILATGSIYAGQWMNGMKNGHGSYLQKASDTIYEGEWKEDKKDGKGILKISEKQFYEGIFIKSVKNGYGKELFSNGDFYQGEYKDGRFHGNGKYRWANGASYEGQFVNGQRNGRGRWKSGKSNYDVYIGQYKEDKKSGKGVYTWSNGCIYDGNFSNDLKEGQGRVVYPGGKQIRGFWQKGKLIQIDSKIEESQISTHRESPLEMPQLGKVIEMPSKILQCSKWVSQI